MPTREPRFPTSPPTSVEFILPEGVAEYVDGYPVGEACWVRCWWGNTYALTVALDPEALRVVCRQGGNQYRRSVEVHARATIIEERRLESRKRPA